jgi:uncharacterized DUF497 family protein
MARAAEAGVKLLVFRAGCVYRGRLERLLQAHGIAAFRLLELGTLDGILGCVGAGVGITLLPRAVAGPAGGAGEVSNPASPAGPARACGHGVRPPRRRPALGSPGPFRRARDPPRESRGQPAARAGRSAGPAGTRSPRSHTSRLAARSAAASCWQTPDLGLSLRSLAFAHGRGRMRRGAAHDEARPCGTMLEVRVEWDAPKAAANLRKHAISFDEAATALGDPFAATVSDPDHSDMEHRFLTFGVSVSGCLLVVAHTEQADLLRIISARLATSRERRIYEEG